MTPTTAATTPAPRSTLLGILAMCAAMAAFTINDAAMKHVTQNVPLMQAMALRGLVASVALMLIGAATGALRLPPLRRDRQMIGLRTLAEVAATVTFLTALMHMPLANISAILQVLPLAVTLAAALILGEPVGWRRLAAIATGFVGVLLIVRPGTDGFDRWALLALASVACVVVRDLATRQLSAAVPTPTVALAAAASVALTGAAGMAAAGGWQRMTGGEVAVTFAAAAFVVAGYLFIVKAMRLGDVASVAPFRYTSLVVAIVLGWAIFGTLPDPLAFLGAGLIVAAGLYAFWRETRLRRSGKTGLA